MELTTIEKIKQKFFGYNYLILDAENKIEYGFHFFEYGKSYRLKTLINGKWKFTAWTYHSTHNDRDSLVKYLLWLRDKKKVFYNT